MVRLQQQMAACTDIQTNWGVFAAKKCRLESKHRWRSEREGKQRMKASAVTKLTSAWRRFYYQNTYKRTVRRKCCFLRPHKITARISWQPFFISRCDYLSVNYQARHCSKESWKTQDRTSHELQHDANSNAVEKVCSGEIFSAKEICSNCTAGCSSNVGRCETMEDVKTGDFICLHEVSVSGCVYSHC